MPFIIPNQAALESGASQLQFGCYGHGQAAGWQDMATAPRDGSWVEIMNTYGVAASYAIARWTDEGSSIICSNGPESGTRRPYKKDHPEWTTKDGGGYISEENLKWRAYTGDPDAYIDPTGGLQNDMAYWRGAVAAKYGLPLNYFEAEAAKNERRNSRLNKPKRNWLDRLFGF